MKWIPQDIETFLNAKEYVDTALIPLIPIGFEKDMKQSASMSEFIMLIINNLERQFTGRILLFPPFTYLKNENEEKMLMEIQNWTKAVKMCEFRHIFYITSDSDWKMHEEKLNTNLLWVPAPPMDKLDDSQMIPLIDNQVKQIQDLFVKKWRGNL